MTTIGFCSGSERAPRRTEFVHVQAADAYDACRMLVSTESGGLGNRIKSWISARRLSADARLYWPLTPNMPARFNELFVNDVLLSEVPPDARTYKSWRLAVLPEDEAFIPKGFAVVGGGAHPIMRGIGAAWWRLTGQRDDRYRFMLFPKQHSRRSTRRDARHIDLEYGRIPEQIRAAYCPLFSELQPQHEIEQRVRAWWDRHGDDSYVGVQVRTWRDYPKRYRKYHLPARARLVRLMRAEPERVRFLVVSDSDEFIDFLSAEFGSDRIVGFDRLTQRDDSYNSAQGTIEDLIDMLLLARCQRIFASYLSTFSEVAWWLGGAQAEVTVF